MQNNILRERQGFFFLLIFSILFYLVFAVLLCRCAVLWLLFFRTYSIYIKIINYVPSLGYVRMCGNRQRWQNVCGVRAVFC